MLKKIGKVQGQHLVELKQFCEDCEDQKLLIPSLTRYAPGRKELWLKHSCDLRKNATIKEGFRNERLERLGNRVLPNFDIGLLLLYTEEVGMQLHRDHSILGNFAVSLNLGECNFLIQESRNSDKIISTPLKEGEVIKFNTKLLHGVETTAKRRFSIVFWHFK